MKPSKILIVLSAEFTLAERHLEQIRQAAPGSEIQVVTVETVTRADVAAAEVIIGWAKPAWVAEEPGVRWVQLATAGSDPWYGVRTADLLLTKASGTFGIPIAEWVVGTMLMFGRNLHLYRDQQRAARWERRPGAREVFGATVGIVGLGDLGREVARRVRALGCRVIGSRRGSGPAPEGVDAVLPVDDLLPLADYLVLAVPGTPATRNLMNADRFARMKRGAYLLNVGRGTAVDEPALVAALQSGHLAGAALDVTAVEPLAPESPLWQMEQVIITPHVSPASPEGNADRRTEIFCENLRRYRAGEPLMNLVNREAGY